MLTRWLREVGRRAGVYAGAFTFAATVLSALADGPPRPDRYRSRYLDQGWGNDERLQFYYTSQGSQLVPYDWFRALEQPDGQKPFNDPEFMDRLRYLPMPADGRRNPDGLPVGFVKDDNPETVLLKLDRLAQSVDRASYPTTNSWMGLTCAACHTNRVEYKGRSLVIDGAPAQADFQRLLELLVDALQATLNDDGKMDRFADKVLAPPSAGAERSALRRRVEAVMNDLRDEVRRNGTGPDRKRRYGFARLDAFGRILNNVCASAPKIPGNEAPSDAPVSYPFLWDTPMLDWVQWNGSASNPLGRNVGEVLGVFAQLDLTGNPKQDLFRSSASIRTLGRLEGMVKSLKAPAWPDELFGMPDAAKAAAGKALFAQNCAGCHPTRAADGEFPKAGKNPLGPDLIRITMVPLDKIGTDPTMAKNFLQRRAKPGVLKDELAGQLGADGKVPVAAFLIAAVGGVTDRKFREDGRNLTEQMKLELAGNRPPKTPTPEHLMGYKARPLNGIWATAPYLHNGSVPTLHQLLLPAGQRLKVFYVGSRELDPRHVGFECGKADGLFEYDTAVPGNSNAGHEGPMYTQTRGDGDTYRDFTEDERAALVEYMKTLK